MRNNLCREKMNTKRGTSETSFLIITIEKERGCRSSSDSCEIKIASLNRTAIFPHVVEVMLAVINGNLSCYQ